MHKIYSCLCAAILLLCIITGPGTSTDEYTSVSEIYQNSGYAPDHIIVKYDSEQFITASSESPQDILKNLSDMVPGLQVIKLPDTMTVEEALDYYRNLPGVIYAEPDYYVSSFSIPNDEYFYRLWGMDSGPGGMNAVSAWNITTGSAKVIVAVLDMGVNISHPDLINNLWINPDEIPDNEIDDDENGYVDDYYGWNFVDDTNDPSNYNAHGTHCAGIIGAVGNNSIGVCGVAWDVSMMSLRAGNLYNLPTSAIIEGISYAKNEGADIVSCSFGSTSPSVALLEAIANCPDMLFVCSAGNTGTDQLNYPAAYDIYNIISVTAVDQNGDLADFASYGPKVDVAAPGVDIYSTVPTLSSTSLRFYLNDTTRDEFGILTDTFSGDGAGWNFIGAGIEGASVSGNVHSLIYSKKTFWLIGEPSGLQLSYGYSLYGPDRYDVIISNTSFDEYISVSDLEEALETNTGVMILKTVDDLGNPYLDVSYVHDVIGNGPYSIGYLYRADDIRSSGQLYRFTIDTAFEMQGNSYKNMSGTSMAAPMVSGLAALIKSADPKLTNIEIKQIILDTVDTKASLNGLIVTGGIVNASAAINAATYADMDHISLLRGWNFISVPKTLDTNANTAEQVFGDVNINETGILGFDADAREWIRVQPDDIIHPLTGYWIKAEESASVPLLYPSIPTEPSETPLYTGWNAIGLSAADDTSAQNALACLNSSWKTLIPWNLTDGAYDSAIINGGSGAYSPERSMTLGNGYWLYVDAENLLVGLTG